MDESSAAVLLGVKQELSITPAIVSRYHGRPNQVGKPASGGYLKVGEPLYRLSSGELVSGAVDQECGEVLPCSVSCHDSGITMTGCTRRRRAKKKAVVQVGRLERRNATGNSNNETREGSKEA